MNTNRLLRAINRQISELINELDGGGVNTSEEPDDTVKTPTPPANTPTPPPTPNTKVDSLTAKQKI